MLPKPSKEETQEGLMNFIRQYMAFVDAPKAEQEKVIYHENIGKREGDYLWDCWQHNSFAGFFLHLDRKNTQLFLSALDVDLSHTKLYDRFVRFAANNCPSSLIDPLPEIKGFTDYGSAENWGRLMLWSENGWLEFVDWITNQMSIKKGV